MTVLRYWLSLPLWRSVTLAGATGIVLAITIAALGLTLTGPQGAQAAVEAPPTEAPKAFDIVNCRDVPTRVWVPPRTWLTPFGWVRTGGYWLNGTRTICEVVVQAVRSAGTAEGARQAGADLGDAIRTGLGKLSNEQGPPERPEVITYPPPVSTTPAPTPAPTTEHEREIAAIQADIKEIRAETERIRQETERTRAYNEARYGGD